MSSPRRSRRVKLAGIVGATVLAVAACGGDDDAGPVESPATDPVESPTPESAPTDGGEAAPAADVPGLLQFSAPLVGGGEIDAASTAGTPTAFWFWSPT